MRAFDRLDAGSQRFVLTSWLGHSALDECLAYCAQSQDMSSQRATAIKVVRYRAERTLDDPKAPPLEHYLGGLPGWLAGELGQRSATAYLVDAVRVAVDDHLAQRSDPFQRAYDAVTAVADTACGPAPSDRPLRFRIYVRLSEKVHDLPIQVNGKVSATDRRIDVELYLTTSAFGVREAAAAPYTLFHEVIAHAFAHQVAGNDVGSFAEGWMDRVAFDVHQAAVGREAPLGGLVADFPFGQRRTLRAARELHQARYASEPNERLAECRSVARDAAEELLAEFEHLAPDGRELFWKLSAATNRSSMRPVTRNEACEALGLLLQPETPPQAVVNAVGRCIAGLRQAAGPDEEVAVAEEFWWEIEVIADAVDAAYHVSLES